MVHPEDPLRELRPGDIDLESLLSSLGEIQREMARSTQRMALETADAWSRDRLAHVWVNARGAVIQVDLDDDLFARASSTEVAAATVEAAQTAAVEIGEKVATYQSALWAEMSQLGLPDARQLTQVDEFKQLQPKIPLSAPGSRERRVAVEALGPEPVEQHAGEDLDDWSVHINDKT